AAVLACGGLVVSAAVAEPPSDEDIAASRAAEAQTAASIGQLEVQLAELASQAESAAIRAQQANEAYLVAQGDLAEATRRAEEAREAAEAALAEVEVQ